MNKISTLFAFVCSFVFGSQAWAQTSQSFNSAAEVATLSANCWTFTRMSYNSADLSGSTGSLLVEENASSILRTPLLDIPSTGLIISFKYQVLSPLKNGTNLIKVNLVSDNGVATNPERINLSNPSGVISYSVTLSGKDVSGSKRIQIEVVNGSLLIDDFYTNANPTPGACISLSPMPVKLMNFQGAVASNRAQLQWSVADNETGSFFQVLRSTDGKSFTESATLFINAKVGAERYTFTDTKDLDAVTYYKLKIVNKDGSTSYSNVIALKSATAPTGSTLNILQNPVESTLNFNYTAASVSQSTVSLYSTTGVKVYSGRISSQKGLNTVSLNLDNHMAAGTYLLEVSNGTERTVSRLVKK